MEDVYVVSPSIHDDPGRAYFGVFDGHAGSRAAQYCGQRMLDNITATAAWGRRDVLAATRFGMARTEQAYLRAALSATPRWFDGTTAVVVLLVDGVLTVGWVGDLRAVLGRRNERSKQWTAFELSRDHKPTHPLEYKRITNLGGSVGRSLKEATSGGVAKSAGSACPVFCFGANADSPVQGSKRVIQRRFNVSPMRCYPGGLSLSRSIGDVTLKYHPTKVVVGEPEVVQQRLNADDRFVILACDGIWDVLSNEKAVSVVAKAIKDKQDAAKALVRASFLNGSTDNMTAVVVHLAQA
ncbi:protein phosphatase 2C [Aureococcus anophagefferens]|nr:protein phosphatase 2C [Aureococcus anophagefferens]